MDILKMDIFKITCKKDVYVFFKKGKEYEAHWDSGYNLISVDETGNRHTIAIGGINDIWFHEHFYIV